MLSKRSFLRFTAAIPFVGSFAPIEAAEKAPEPAVYAYVGETVTCENGHPICSFIKTVKWGESQQLDKQLGAWRQEAPEIGAFPIPGCARCGAPFCNGTHFHVGSSWRV